MSAPSASKLSDPGLVEVAFVGRSNVGKSSLLGCLLKRPKLVRTSRTPGRTQLLNLFVFQGRYQLVDLPGYGFARASKVQRRKLLGLIHSYLSERTPLAGVVQLIDARRGSLPQADLEMVHWLVELGRPVLIALTKIDLVPKNRRHQRARALEKALGIPGGTAICCSAKTGEGRSELFAALEELERP